VTEPIYFELLRDSLQLSTVTVKVMPGKASDPRHVIQTAVDEVEALKGRVKKDKIAMNDCAELMDGVGDAARLSGAFGAIGSAGGDLAERGFLSITRETPLIEGLQSSGTLIGTTPRESLGSSIGTGVGIGISNASSAID